MRKLAVSVVLSLLLVGGVLAQGASSSGSTSPAKTKASKKGASAVDCTTVDDAKITEEVKAKIAKAASLKDLTINVETKGGEVTLTGSVKTGSQKGVATRMAKGVACVKKVTNQITVEQAKMPKPKK
jgi:osmotically-inducible protein OsmY